MYGAVRTSYKRIMEQENRLHGGKTVLLFVRKVAEINFFVKYWEKGLHWLLGAGIECILKMFFIFIRGQR